MYRFLPIFLIVFLAYLFFPRDNIHLSSSEALSGQETAQNTISEQQSECDLRSEAEKWEFIWKREPIQSQIIQEIKDVFGKDWRIALAIAKAESGLDKNAIGDKHLRYWQGGEMFGDSVGVFQIRRFPNRPSKEELLNFKTNIAYAKKLYDEQKWSPWSVWKSGKYKKYF